LISFFKEVNAELHRVVWPSKEQVIRLTMSVIVISAITGAFLGALDYIFTSGMTYLL